MDNYDKQKVVDLRAECKRRGLQVSGIKSNLISRLEEDDKQSGSNQNTNARTGYNEQTNSYFEKDKVINIGELNNSSHRNGNGSMLPKLTLPHTDSEYDMWTERKEAEKAEREKLVLWRKPLTVSYYSTLEAYSLAVYYTLKLWALRLYVLIVFFSAVLLYMIYKFDGPHQAVIIESEKTLIWCAYWVWLGILSSIGLGTGLHTFVLYLGPHIAKVTMAAYECKSLDFPEPPYPNDVICPAVAGVAVPSIWAIMSKIRLECFCWGAGTALGELPPYFIARTARLSGLDPDSEEFDEFEELMHESQSHEKLPIGTRLKLGVHRLVQKLGFWGILLCASIPNPLFDLAGITCGHFLIPFTTFFFATLLGKAVFKMHLQMLFVIFAFSAHLVTGALTLVSHVSVTFKVLLEDALEKQRAKLHSTGSTSGSEPSQSLLQKLFEWLVVIMVLYFLLSIINSLAQSYHKRLSQRTELKYTL